MTGRILALTHRQKFTCRVCHFELKFNMLVNSTEITETANRLGRNCGTGGCHDGKAAFGHVQAHYQKCHNGNVGYVKEKFSRLSNLPKSKFGNGINWVMAMDKGMISPVNYLTVKPPTHVAVIKPIMIDAGGPASPGGLLAQDTRAMA
jgi:c(7)-type cytochrome triheme protein